MPVFRIIGHPFTDPKKETGVSLRERALGAERPEPPLRAVSAHPGDDPWRVSEPRNQRTEQGPSEMSATENLRFGSGASRSLPGVPQCRLIEPVAGTRLGRRELVLLPRSRPCRRDRGTARSGANLSFVLPH
jgi:hypothetical protein